MSSVLMRSPSMSKMQARTAGKLVAVSFTVLPSSTHHAHVELLVLGNTYSASREAMGTE